MVLFLFIYLLLILIVITYFSGCESKLLMLKLKAPIAVFDKQRFQLLDANEAMANFVGHTSVASLSTEVVTMDDLVNPEAAHIAKKYELLTILFLFYYCYLDRN